MYLGTAGFSAGGWYGTPDPDPRFKFGILGVSPVTLYGSGEWCDPASHANDSFDDGADFLHDDGVAVHAFWVVTGPLFPELWCNTNGVTPCAWGKQQALEFGEAVTSSSYDGPVEQMIADVESDAAGGWSATDYADNIEVVFCFEFWLKYVHPTHPLSIRHLGVYFRYLAGWQGTFDSPEAWELVTPMLWLADYGPPFDTLHARIDALDEAGYHIWGWQFATNTDPYCSLTYDQAKDNYVKRLWDNYGLLIARYDMWTKEHPEDAC